MAPLAPFKRARNVGRRKGVPTHYSHVFEMPGAFEKLRAAVGVALTSGSGILLADLGPTGLGPPLALLCFFMP